MLGVVYAAQGKFREAVAATERGLEFAPEAPMAYFNIGKSLYLLGEFENAAESFEKTTELVPDFPDAFYLLGKCYRELREKEQEFNAYLDAVELAPDFADAMFALGTVYAHLTETLEGRKVEYFEPNGELNLDDARIFFYMRLAQLAFGNVETVVEQQPELREMDEDLAEQLKYFIDHFNEHEFMHISIGNEMMEEPEEIDLDAEKLKKFQGCLLGGAVGDALGAAIEFDSIERIRQQFGAAGLTDYASAYGRIGAITDDTQMTLFTAEGLLRGETRRMHKGIYSAIRAIYSAYMRWLETQGVKLNDTELKSSVYEVQSWLCDLPELNSRRAPGNSCLSALNSGKMGIIEQPINNSKGCGGVMRVAPIGLVALDPFKMAMDAAAITHGHPTGYLSAGVLAVIINQIIEGKSLTETVNYAIYEELPKHKDHEETFAACDKATKLAADKNSQPTPKTVETLGGGWIAEEALAISIYCALVHENDFEKAVLLAVNHTGDSDSTGAITGNVLGAFHGIDAIPEKWLAPLELRKTIEEIAEDLLIGFQTGEEWWDKYPGV